MNKTIVLYLVVILSSVSLFSCSKENETDILNQRINDLVSAIEKHDVHEINEFMTNDFSTMKALNKPQFLLFLQYHFKNNKNIFVTILDKEIVLRGKNADVTVKVLLLGANEWLPERGQVYKVACRWKKISGEWVMSRLRWEKE